MSTRRIMRGLIGVLWLTGLVIAVACGDEESAEDRVRDTARETGDEIRQETRGAWAQLRTDTERLIDDVQARNDPDAKQELLDHCRDLEERLRRDDAGNADRVNEFCDNVRDADVNDNSAWQDIKTKFQELDDRFRS